MDKSQLAGSLIRSYYVTYMSLVSLVSIVFALGAAGGVFSRCWTRGLDDVEKKKFVGIPALPSASLSHSCDCPICDKPLNKERIHGILEHNDDSSG